jgi:hypothetical protein
MGGKVKTQDRQLILQQSWVWWVMPAIPVLGRLRQENDEIKAI